MCSQRLLKKNWKMARKVSSRKQLVLLKMIQNSRRRRSAMQKLIVLLRRRRKLLIRLTFVALLLTFSRNNTTTIRYRTCRRLQRNTGWIERALNTFSEDLTGVPVSHMSLSTCERRLLLHDIRAIWFWSFNRKRYSEWSHSSDHWGTLGWTCIKTFPKRQAAIWRKDVGYGRAMAVPLQLGCNRWLPYTPEMPRWWFGSV